MRKKRKVQSLEEIPEFGSEAEEARFWGEHELGEPLLEAMAPPPEGLLPPPRPRTRAISLRLDEDLLRRLKAMARRKGKGYQTLLKEFVLERLYEEEKREGVI
ncbi:CopG antitoxin of type II toxin-antitoxin system, partial [Thermus arciformis]